MPTVVSILQKRAKKVPARVAYLHLAEGLHETETLTYGVLDKKARAIAAFLQSKAMQGQRVLLFFPAGLDFITALFGCFYAGVIAVPAFCGDFSDFEEKQNFIKTIAQQSQVSGVLTERTFLALLNEVKQQVFSESEIFITDSTRFDDCSILYQKVNIKPNSVAYLQYTSGATSDPKAAVISHKNLLHSIKQSSLSWRYNRKSISLTWMPHSHVYSLVCGILVPFYSRSLAIIMPPHVFKRKPFLWLRALSKYQVTHSGCPNYGYDLCVEKIECSDFTRLNLKSWKVAINWGEQVSLETIDKFVTKFKPVGFAANAFCCAYGMAELTGPISISQYKHGANYLRASLTKLTQNKIAFVKKKSSHSKLISSGTLLSGLEVQILDPDNLTKLPECRIGEIVIRGRTLARGYWNDSQNFKTVVPGSAKIYFRTGDLGFIRRKQLYVTGRCTDIISRSGKNYYPHDLENCVVPMVQKYSLGARVVFSIPISGREEVIFLQEIKGEITETDYNRIIYSIRLAVLKHHCIELHNVLLLQEKSLPTNSSGKLSRKNCAQLYLDNQLKLYSESFEEKLIDNDTAEESLSPSIIQNIEQPLKQTDIAIIGMHGMFPDAPDLMTFWNNILQGKEVLKKISPDSEDVIRSDLIEYYGGFLDNVAEFDAEFFNIPPKVAEVMDPQQRLFLQTAWKTIEDAGYGISSLQDTKVGVFVGVCHADYAQLLQKHSKLLDQNATRYSNIANKVSNFLNLQGPSEVIDTACSSSLVALNHAILALQNGDCEMALIGGVNVLLTTDISSPMENRTPRSEGIAAILIKPLLLAKEEGDHIYAVIKGCAVNHNDQANVIVTACKRAGISSETINYIETHGIGNEQTDLEEVENLKKAFTLTQSNKPSTGYCALGAIKNQMGHLEAAAGIASLIKVVLSMQHQFLPENYYNKRSTKLELSDTPFYLLKKTEPWQRLKDSKGAEIPRRAGISSFGFGGSNAHVILEEFLPTPTKTEVIEKSSLITLSAKTKKALENRLIDLLQWLPLQDSISLEQLSFNLNLGREHFEYRIAFMVTSLEEFHDSLSAVMMGIKKDNTWLNDDIKKPQNILQELCNSIAKEIGNNRLTLVDYRQKLMTMAGFYVEGYVIDWKIIYGDKIERMSLPTYPFAKDAYWFTLSSSSQAKSRVEIPRLRSG